jgi:hypothetical protein
MIAVAGASGFLGRAVCDALGLRGVPVLRIGRRDADVQWPAPRSDFDRVAADAIARCRAVVNLAGASIGTRWTTARRQAIRDSRAGLTTVLARCLARLDRPPATLLSASAVGIYGNHGDAWVDESTAPGTDFLATVAQEWEAATLPASEAGVRVVCMRLGVVIGPGGGMVGRLRLPFALGMGARLGRGTQWMSWIALEDVVAFVVRAIDDAAFTGPVNLASPEPVTNAEFTRQLARQLGRRAVFAAPGFALRAALGDMADAMLLASQRVRPTRLLEHRFRFAHTRMETALRTAVHGVAA